MIPIILVSQDVELTANYIRDLTAQLQIKPYNVFTYDKDGTVITIEQMRDISKLARESHSDVRLIVVNDFDSGLEVTQNAFLKTLEENTYQTQFILCVSSESSIIPTIKSRSKIINLKSKVDTKTFPLMSTYKVLEGNSLVSLSATSKISKENAVKLIDEIILYCRSELLNTKEQGRALEYCGLIQKTFGIKNLINGVNLNPEHGVDHVLLSLNNELSKP